MRHITLKRFSWLLGLAWLASSAAVNANAADQFVGAKGFGAVKLEKMEGSRYYATTRFPKIGASAFHPDADLPAPVRAMLMMDSHEGVLPHARYLVNYQPTSEGATPDNTHDFVDITRFNLGPAVHADLARSVPAEHLANVKSFGVGPHALAFCHVAAARHGGWAGRGQPQAVVSPGVCSHGLPGPALHYSGIGRRPQWPLETTKTHPTASLVQALDPIRPSPGTCRRATAGHDGRGCTARRAFCAKFTAPRVRGLGQRRWPRAPDNRIGAQCPGI